MKIKGHILFGDTVSGIIKYHTSAKKVNEGGVHMDSTVGTLHFDVEEEVGKFDEAVKTHIQALTEAKANQLQNGNKIGSDILDAHILILEDEGFIESFRETIADKHMPAAKAINTKCAEYEERFKMSGVDFLVTKADDIRDICNALIGIICHLEPKDYSLSEPTVLVARELLPCDLLKYATGNLVGLVLEKCSRASHVFILANSLGIPVMADIRTDSLWDGHRAILDCRDEYLIIDPSEEENACFANPVESDNPQDSELLKYINEKVISPSGKRIYIGANISGESDLEAAKKNGADGIGLLRSEMAYLEADNWPTENELFDMYSGIIKKMEGRPVTIRTLDIGADKTAPYMNISKEENPALGLRAIRQCLARPDVFRTQLRAIYKAAQYGNGNLSVMYPMISSVEELQKVKEISGAVRRELRAEGLLADDTVVKEGIMIETPAAALLSAQLAKMADFFSIGTNDLTQFVYAVDRNNSAVSSIYNDSGEAILNLIRMVVENAHKEGIYVGMCGELAGDTDYTDMLVEMGLDELSVSPGLILKIKQKIMS